MGELRGHSKMEGLQSDSDQKALEKAGVNSLDFSNGVRMEPKPHYYGGWWTEYGGCNSSSCNSCVMVYLKTRNQRFNQIFPVNTVETMKLEYRVAKTTGLVTVALILSFVSAVILSLLGDFFQFFIKCRHGALRKH